MQASVSKIKLHESGFSKVKGFRMAMLNIVSLPKHIDEVRILLATSKFDILAINETRLDRSISDDLVSIPNYDIISFDRNRYGGGVCIFVNNSISYRNLNHITPENLEAICIEVYKPYTRPFVIATLYRPPNCSVDVFSKIENLFDNLDSEQKEMYLLGDLNCNMLDSSSHVTKRLTSLVEMYQHSQIITKPTRLTQTTASLLDVCGITSNSENVVSADVVPLA